MERERDPRDRRNERDRTRCERQRAITAAVRERNYDPARDPDTYDG